MEFKNGLNFGDVLYSIVNNKIAEWKIEGIYFQAYHRDSYNNPITIAPPYKNPDIEYRIVRWDKNKQQITESIAHCNNIGLVFFKTKDDLFKSMEE